MDSHFQLAQRVNVLKDKIAQLREKTIVEKIAQLRKDNETLKLEVDSLRRQYEDALLSNGRSVTLLANAVPNKTANTGVANEFKNKVVKYTVFFTKNVSNWSLTRNSVFCVLLFFPLGKTTMENNVLYTTVFHLLPNIFSLYKNLTREYKA